jgi:hypothetical protein
MRGPGTKLALLGCVGMLALAGCDKVKAAATFPWLQAATPTPSATPDGPPPPPPTVASNPLDPGATTAPVSGPTVVPDTVPNPNANPGAPVQGTPFDEKPVNPNIPISDDNKPLGENGLPVTLPPPPTEAAGPNPGAPPSTAPSPGPTATSSASPSPTATASGSSSPKPSPLPSASPTASPKPSPTATASTTPSPTPTPSSSATPAKFFYFRASALEPGSGTGAKEADKILVPDMLFPIKSAPTFAQSQVYRYGGSVKGGDQCDVRNFQAPWRDNYCESRSVTATTPWCPVKGVHLGQDLRVGTPEGCKLEKATAAKERQRYEIVAVEDGIISNVGSYSINLTAAAGGRIYRMLHLNMSKLKVKIGQSVKKGDLLGYVSNDFGGTPTTLHLHFELKLNTAENGWQYAPVYSSLLAAYQRREGTKGEQVADNFAVASTKPKPQ